jgi:2-dehydro-3-deoxy-D-arabinonate dehydratase
MIATALPCHVSDLPEETVMTSALFRVRLPSDKVRLARGSIETGPEGLLAPDASLDRLLASGPDAVRDAAMGPRETVACPADVRVLAPIESQEVWCTGLTYERTHEARVASSPDLSIYDRLYEAERPELFFKAPGWRVRGPGEAVAVRADSGWDMAEPELGLVVAADGRIAGHVIANDMTSRALEAENPLYLPQAKVYDGGCALGPAIVPVDEVEDPVDIRMRIRRGDEVLFEGGTNTGRLRRSLVDVVEHLFRALTFPVGVVLLTGNGVVPDPSVRLPPGDAVRIEMAPLGRLENPVESVG